MASEQETRERIAQTALKYVGSQAWSDGVSNGNYPANSNKCNLFVYTVLTEADASPGLPNGHWWWHQYPPQAGQWADPSYAIPHWHVLAAGVAPAPGDVISQSIDYSDASGHVMVVGQNGQVIGTGDSSPGPHGTVEMVPTPLKMGPRPKGPEVYRRWTAAP